MYTFNFNEQVFEMIGRSKIASAEAAGRPVYKCANHNYNTEVVSEWYKHLELKHPQDSRAAAVIGKECQMIVSNNPTRQRSKATSVTGNEINKVKEIAEFLKTGY
jgi:hypothetical protein